MTRAEVKIFPLAALLAAGLLLAGCGKGGVTSTESQNTGGPKITGLSMPMHICEQRGFKVSFDYTDPDGATDVTEAFISINGIESAFSTDGSGTFTTMLEDVYGLNSADVSVYVSDSGGNVSAPLGSTAITPLVDCCTSNPTDPGGTPTDNPPTICCLDGPSAVCVYQNFYITFNYDDPDGLSDVVKAYMRVGSSSDATVEYVNGSGTHKFGYSFSYATSSSKITVWVEDSAGNLSDQLVHAVYSEYCGGSGGGGGGCC